MKKRLSLLGLIWLLIILLSSSSLATWQTQKTHWPRLTYKASDLPIIREHLEAAQKGVEPYKTLWERIQRTANSTLKLDNKAWGQQNANGSIIKARAFIYALTGDKTQLDKVREELTGFYTGEEIPEYGLKAFSLSFTPLKNLKSMVMQSIHIAQSLTLHCQAYDILKGAGYDFGATEKTITTNIATLAKRLYDVSNWISSGAKAANLLVDEVEEQNNFQLKITSALGLAAICLNNHPSAEKWINRSMSKFWQVFSVQTTPQGGYGEGPFYFVYACLNFVPFFRAYNLFMEGQGGNFENYTIQNFLTNDRVANVLDWHIKIRMPNGDRPGYDDGYYTPFMTGILVSSPKFSGHATDHPANANLGVYAWDWMNTEQMTGGYANQYFSEFANLDLTVDIFCTFDANVKPVEPPGSPTQFLPDAGNVVFRSGWDKNAVYFHLLGEKGPMRLMGGVHEHPDAGSFVIYAFGELLALDAGYPGYPQHDLVNQAQNHNVLLVDDAGPTTDAELKDFFDTPTLDAAAVKMAYGGADIMRHVFFVDNRFFLINDRLQSAAQHSYTWLLHGYAGADLPQTIFSATTNGAVWKRPKASLETAVVSYPGPPIYEQTTDYHSIIFAGNNQLPKHAVLRAKQRGTNVGFAAVLTPTATGMNAPVVRPLQSKSGTGLQIDFKNGELLFNLVRGDSTLVRAGSYVTDSDVALITQKAGSSFPRIFCVKNATSFRVGKEYIFSTTQKCHFILALDANQKQYTGYFDGPSATTVRLKMAITPPQVSGVKTVTYQPTSQTLQLEFDKSGYFRIRL